MDGDGRGTGGKGPERDSRPNNGESSEGGETPTSGESSSGGDTPTSGETTEGDDTPIYWYELALVSRGLICSDGLTRPAPLLPGWRGGYVTGTFGTGAFGPLAWRRGEGGALLPPKVATGVNRGEVEDKGVEGRWGAYPVGWMSASRAKSVESGVKRGWVRGGGRGCF